MFIWFFNYIFGYSKIKVSAANKEKLLNLLLLAKIISWGFSSLENEASINILNKDRVYFSAGAKEKALDFEFVSEHGLPKLLRRYKKRLGVVLGVLLCAFLFTYSSFFVWDIKVSGNKIIDSAEIVNALDSLGFGVGSYIPKANTGEICNRYLINDKNMAWISINMVGTVANVEVIEALTEVKTPQTDSVGNVVSMYDAKIMEISLKRGKVSALEGQMIKAGQLLISGVYETQKGTVFLHADGKVTGIVSEYIKLQIPLLQSVKVYTNEITIGRSVSVFGKEINFFQYSGNLPATYDKIERNSPLYIFGVVKLPIAFCRSYAAEYELQTVTIKETDAVTIAKSRLNTQIALLLSDAELCTKTIDGHFEDDLYIIECLLETVREIGTFVEFEVK